MQIFIKIILVLLITSCATHSTFEQRYVSYYKIHGLMQKNVSGKMQYEFNELKVSREPIEIFISERLVVIGTFDMFPEHARYEYKKYFYWDDRYEVVLHFKSDMIEMKRVYDGVTICYITNLKKIE